MEKIILINPDPNYASGTNEGTMYPPINLGYLAAILEKEGIICKIIDACIFKLEDKEVLEQTREFNPDLIGITANIVTIKAALKLADKLKESLKKFIVLGGPSPTSQPDYTLRNCKADCVIRNEGEITILDLIKNLNNLSSVKGISYREGSKIIHNKPRELIKDLDSIPFPAYHLLPNLKLYRSRSRGFPVAPLLSSRGCPFQCIFCNKNIYGHKFRTRSPENVVKEIEYLVNEYGVKQIEIVDDNFTLDTKRAEKIFDLIIEKKLKVLFNFQNGLRADTLTPRLVKKMKKAGTYKVSISVESGNKKIQKTIKKYLDLNVAKKAVKMLRKEGIVVFAGFMLGLPYENEKTMQDTINFAKELNPHFANFMVVIPFPDTELYEIIEKHGKFVKDIKHGSDTGFYTSNFYYELGDLKPKTVLKYTKKAYKEFYSRPTKTIDTLSTIKTWREFKWTFTSILPLIDIMRTKNEK